MELAIDKLLEIGGAAAALLGILILAARKVYADLRKDLLAAVAAKESQGTAFLSMFSELTADNNVQLKSLEVTLKEVTRSNDSIAARIQHLEDRVEKALDGK